MKSLLMCFLFIILIAATGCNIGSDNSRYLLHNFGDAKNEGVIIIDTQTGMSKLLHYRNSNGERTRNKLGMKFGEIPVEN